MNRHKVQECGQRFQSFKNEQQPIETKCGAIYGIRTLSSRSLFTLALRCTALRCDGAVLPDARPATRGSLASDVEEGAEMTTTTDAQQPGCAKINMTTSIAAAGNDDGNENNVEGVAVKNSSSLSSPVDGFVARKWMRDRTRASAAQATGGVSWRCCTSRYGYNIAFGIFRLLPKALILKSLSGFTTIPPAFIRGWNRTRLDNRHYVDRCSI